MKKEPALIIGFITAILSLLIIYGVLNAEQAAAWGAVVAALIPLAQGLITRRFVFSENTIEKAGIAPEEIVEQAKANDASAGRTI